MGWPGRGGVGDGPRESYEQYHARIDRQERDRLSELGVSFGSSDRGEIEELRKRVADLEAAKKKNSRKKKKPRKKKNRD